MCRSSAVVRLVVQQFDIYFPCISNCWARPRVYRKLYILIGGQRAEKFEKHWSSTKLFRKIML